MKTITCAFCGSEMEVHFLESKSNQYCNSCFEQRAEESGLSEELTKIEFFGVEIDLDD